MKLGLIVPFFILAGTISLAASVAEIANSSEIINSSAVSDYFYSDRILGVDTTSFPKISIDVVAASTCARSGALKKSDFKIFEDNSSLPIDNLYFTRNAPGHGLDVAVVIDNSQSMSDEIDALKSKVKDLMDEINRSKMDARYCLVAFRESASSEKIHWTDNSANFERDIGKLLASGGSNLSPENSIEGIECALSGKFRPNAQKVVVVVTDEPSYQKGDGGYHSIHSLTDVSEDLMNAGAMLVAVSPDFSNPFIDAGVPRSDLTKYADMRELASRSGGVWIDIDSANFSSILDEIQGMLVGTYILEYRSPIKIAKPKINVTLELSSSCDRTKSRMHTDYTRAVNNNNLELGPILFTNTFTLRVDGINYADSRDLIEGPESTLNGSDLAKKGNYFYIMRDYDKSIECYDEALKVNATDKITWNNRGVALFHMHRREDSIASFDEAISLDPWYLNALTNKGALIGGEEALKCFDKVIDLDPNFAGVWSNKGYALFDMGQYNESLKCYEKAIDINPEDISAWNNKGNIFIEFGDYIGALECFNKSISIANGASPFEWNNKGVALQRLGVYKEALDCYNKAIEMMPKLSNAWHNKWSVLKALHRDPEAQSVREKAKENGLNI
ncbi:MAG: tetratricopeptide repeat protein [Methanothrix sp.]|nr:tetratricopeptide repeat protein [Methanothrix sp.]